MSTKFSLATNNFLIEANAFTQTSLYCQPLEFQLNYVFLLNCTLMMYDKINSDKYICRCVKNYDPLGQL